MKAEDIIYQNKFCRVITKGTIYVLQSKSGKYNDQYFQTLDPIRKKIGGKVQITPKGSIIVYPF